MAGGIAISGSSGLVGSALSGSLVADGLRVLPMRRAAEPGAGYVAWDPAAGSIDASALEGVDAVVHLAGESVAARRWSPEQKRRIRDSRVLGTRLIVEALAGLARPPRTLVCASAIGYYGSRGDETLVESSEPGRGFLPETCIEWEAASAAAASAGIRVVQLRIGLVLAAEGGALPRMLTPFRLGVGGRIGDGRQYMSWIALADLVRIFRRAIADGRLSGPFNAVAPTPVTNADFTVALGRVLRRPTFFPLPAFMVGLLFGEMGRELLLGSQRVLPERLLEAGFRYELAELEPALRLATMKS